MNLLSLCKWSRSFPFHIKKSGLYNHIISAESIKELNIIQTQGNIKIYNNRNFKVVELYADKEFENTETDLLPGILRICGVDEQVSEIE